MMNSENYEFYRASSVGEALTETLNDLIKENRITGALAVKILHHFDRVVPEVLETELHATMKVKAKIKHYQNVDEVWTFVLKNACFTTKENGQKKDEVQEFRAEHMTILACPARKSTG
jgi:transcription initiation factor TFIIA small subunit